MAVFIELVFCLIWVSHAGGISTDNSDELLPMGKRESCTAFERPASSPMSDDLIAKPTPASLLTSELRPHQKKV